MKFDTIIVGGGLAGLVCGIRLSQEGQRCIIISSGQSALHFSSGSFDLLNTLPDGTKVTEPYKEIEKLVSQLPAHPYSKLGAGKFTTLSEDAHSFFENIGMEFKGSGIKNHYRITPMGNFKPTWLTYSSCLTSEQAGKLPWKKVSVFNPLGFLDFFPKFIAGEFSKLGVETEIEIFDLPGLQYLRRNPSEVRATNISRVLDKESNLRELAEIINNKSINSEAVILPACIGIKSIDSLSILKSMVNKPVCLLPTMPPSTIGIYIQNYLKEYFIKVGGTYMMGDNIEKAEVANNQVKKIYSHNHGNIPFIAKNVVLATGSYFSKGLVACQDRVYEPVFDLDVTFNKDRNKWYDPDMFQKQAYHEFGVKTDNSFKALYKNEPISNLYVCGAILEGFNPIKEGSGAGVSILTAMEVADSILTK